MSMNVGSIDLGLDINKQGFNKQLNGIAGGAQKSVLGAFKPLGKLIGFALGGAAIVSFTKSCLKLGSDLGEVQNVVDVTFQEMNNSVNKFAQNALEQFGLSETVAKKYMGTLGAMSKSMGFTESESYKMAEAITGLSGDIASFYNLSSDEAYTKLKSIWTGETESLKELGVIMTQTNLDQYALNNGFGKTTKNMTEQTKTMLRFQYVMSSLSASQGDFARTSDSWANQTRVLSLRFDSLKATLGQGFINLFTPIIKMINTLVGKLQLLADSFKSFTEMITGKKSESSGLGSVATDIANATSAADGLSDSTSGIGSAAQKASKKIKGALAGFDNLNNASSNNDQATDSASSVPDLASSSSTGLVSDMATGVEEASGKIETVLDKIKSKFDMLKTIDLSNLSTSIGKIKTAIEPITEKLFAGLSWGWDNVLVPLAKWTIEDLLPSFLGLISSALTVLNPLLDSFKGPASWLWESFLQPLATWTGGIIVETLNNLATGLTNISTWMTNNQEVVSGVTTTVLAFFAAWKLTELFGFIQMSGGITSAFTSITTAIWACTGAKLVDKAETLYITALYAKDFVLSIISGTGALIKQAAQWVINTGLKIADTVATTAMTVATGAWNVICGIATGVTTAFGAAVAFLTSPIGLVIIAIGALIAIGVLLYKNWDKIKEVAIIAFTKVRDFLSGVCKNIAEFFKGLWESITKVFSVVGTWFKTKFTEAWTAIKGVFSPVGEFFNGIWKTIKSKFTSIGSSIGDAIGGAFKLVVNGILNFAENTINGFIKSINKAITLINKIPGVNISSLSLLDIPKLAQGGYVGANQPQLAIIGDNKREGEVVAPESKLRQLAIEAVNMAGGSGGITEEIMYRVMSRVFRENPLILEGDAKGIVKLVKQESDAHQKSTGKPLFGY